MKTPKLFIPGPTHVTSEILEAMSKSQIGHRTPEISRIIEEITEGVKDLLYTKNKVLLMSNPASAMWEMGTKNSVIKGLLHTVNGAFSKKWLDISNQYDFHTNFIEYSWGKAIKIDDIDKLLSTGKFDTFAMVHNETSTGVTSKIPSVINEIKSINHPAIIMVDTISSLGSIDYYHDDWNVDVTVAGSQKGLMLPPGIAFNFISQNALDISIKNDYKRSYWDWSEMVKTNLNGFFPYTPSTNILFGLKEALRLIEEEGLDNIFKRHERHAKATRAAVNGWGIELLPMNDDEHSNSLTSLLFKENVNADNLRKIILDKFNTSLGTGLGKWAGKIIRIGHLGDFNDPMLLGTLSAVEMGLSLAEIEHKSGGILEAMNYLEKN